MLSARFVEREEVERVEWLAPRYLAPKSYSAMCPNFTLGLHARDLAV